MITDTQNKISICSTKIHCTVICFCEITENLQANTYLKSYINLKGTENAIFIKNRETILKIPCRLCKFTSKKIQQSVNLHA